MTNMPLIMILHGANAGPYWGFFPYIARHFAQLGWASVRPVIKGISPTEDIDAIHSILNSFTGYTVYFLGHSRGGALAQIVAAERSHTRERVAVWAGISTWIRGSRRIPEQLKHEVAVYAGRLDIVGAARKISERSFYVYTTGDLVVSPQEARLLFSDVSTASNVLMLPASTHTFGITHPMDNPTPSFTAALSSTVRFFQS